MKKVHIITSVFIGSAKIKLQMCTVKNCNPSIKLRCSYIRKDKFQLQLEPTHSHFQRYKCSLDSQIVESEAKPFLKHPTATQLYKCNFESFTSLEAISLPFHFLAVDKQYFLWDGFFFLHCIPNISEFKKINTCLRAEHQLHSLVL